LIAPPKSPDKFEDFGVLIPSFLRGVRGINKYLILLRHPLRLDSTKAE
jgi:hypothetical protein